MQFIFIRYIIHSENYKIEMKYLGTEDIDNLNAANETKKNQLLLDSKFYGRIYFFEERFRFCVFYNL